MKSSERDLLLIPKSGKVNVRRRYFSLRNAIRAAQIEVVERKLPVVVYDAAKGRDIITISQQPGHIKMLIHVSSRTFYQFWSRV